MNPLHRFDDRLFTAVNDLARRTGELHGVVLGYATFGALLFAALLGAGLWLRRADSDRALAAAGWAGLATLLAVALNQPLVGAFGEARPYVAHHGLLVLAHRSNDFSFPSDHAVMAGAAAGGLWLVSRALGALATVAAAAMAFSRVYIGAHYPWDVAAGLLLGALVASVGWVVLRSLLAVLAGWLRVRPGVRLAFAARSRTVSTA